MTSPTLVFSVNVSPVARRRRVAWPPWWPVGLIGLALLAACPGSGGPEVPPLAACPASTLVPAASCQPAPPSPPHNELHHNSLSVMALQGNAGLLGRLASAPLDAHFFIGHTEDLAEPYAPELMKYIASCALAPCASVPIPPRTAGPADLVEDRVDEARAAFPDGFAGELGLCPAWATGAQDQACRERVSACVLARVNKVGKRVEFSMRGDGMTLAARVPVETTFREHGGTPIESFKGCDAQCLWADPVRHNCDWEPRFVGQCVRGLLADEGDPAIAPRRVTLALQVPAGVTDGAGPIAARIRVCPGIHGCDDPDGVGPHLAPPHYSGDPLALDQTGAIATGALVGDAHGTVEFECPANGPAVDPATGAPVLTPTADTVRTGYYSVMLAATTGSVLPAEADVARVPTAGVPGTPEDAYPADEAHVFTYREGAFYGDLFVTPRDATCHGSATFAAEQYVCFSALWTAGAAMASDRFCAGPDDLCFVNEPAGCDGGAPAWDPDLDGVGLPAVGTPPDAPVYDACVGPTQAWHHPYTTYLNHPCDLFASEAACAGYLDPEVARWLAPR